MGKSERRSKWKRKFRALKRDKNSVKELNTLKKVLQNGKSAVDNLMEVATKTSNEIESIKLLLYSLAHIINLLISLFLQIEPTNGEQSTMEVEENKKKYNRKTMLDEKGQYPIWMNQRKIKKLKASKKRIGKKNFK